MLCHCCIRSPSPCISLAFSLTSRYSALGFLRQNAYSAREAEIRFLVVARLYRHGRSQHIRHPDKLRLFIHTNHPSHSTFIPSFVLFIRLFYIYRSCSAVPSPFYCSSAGAVMRGPGPPGYLALSLCTSSDIDVLLFAIAVAPV